ncbi:NAD dependent epimerase/dehydratase [Aspergillus sclerotioniger CBS 115572]|uniref:NAD dependent epimerase/dehydratase n=1 Tax=Aspergillus sclerotioniger CBS 115572 TaxID=1450535 RepID=A0A317VTE9_9EURO|nr:NAD dependent epimerase/dehydratase [Aspergillus sclerotioniger CBS 115572]PWY76118.1 NAD dependent epimerase/dehydratase [Aspergillus sclerotioniger CBS 115572]
MGQKASDPQPGTKLQVIGAGLSRTGTASFSAALNILLDGPVYHGGTQVTMGQPIEIKTWITALRDWLVGQDQQRVLALIKDRTDGYAAITDAPATQFVPELLELYPDSKVICTVRDPVAWAKSIEQISGLATLWFLRAVLLPLPGMRHFVEYISLLQLQWDRVYNGQRAQVEIYHQHIAWLKEIVPADRLVFFDVKDGWEPLCEALGKDVPDVPFPRINDSKAVDQVAEYHIKRGLKRWAGGFAVVGVVTAWFMYG